MNDIYSLLNINSDVIRDYPLLANRVADHQIEKVINNNMRKLKQIEDRMLIDKGIEIPKRSIDEVIRKVIHLSKQNDNSPENWTIRELRIVSYYLMELFFVKQIHYFLNYSHYLINFFSKQYGTTSFFNVFDKILSPLVESYHINFSISSDVVSFPSNNPLYLKT